MINRDIYQMPIVYCNSNRMGKIANGWGCHTTVGNETKEDGIKQALVVTTGLRGTVLSMKSSQFSITMIFQPKSTTR